MWGNNKLTVFIINPLAGGGNAQLIADKLEMIKEKDWILTYTKKAGDSVKLARRYKNRAKIIYSVGGDGTLNEIVNGMVGGTAMLGVIPGGNGNDFYKTIKNHPQVFKSDLGIVNDKYFINVASVGIDAEIAKNANKMKKTTGDTSNIYIKSILYTYFKYKNKLYSINNDNYKKYTILTVCNGRYYGNGFKIAPNAKVDNRILDFYAIEGITKAQIINAITKLVKGTHESLKYVKKQQITNVTIRSKEIMPCNYDGEILEDSVFNFRLAEEQIVIFNNKKLIKSLIVNKK